MDLVEAKARGFDRQPRHPWERARLALAKRLIARHVTLQPGDSVLDIGCGDTFVAEQLASAYPAVQFYAVDSAFTPELIEQFQARIGASNVALSSSLDDVPARPATLILLMDVLEHVPDDAALLKEVRSRSLFDARTRLLVTVPSYQPLFCSHDRFLGHYRRYSTRRLRAAFDAAGLTPIVEGHLFASLLPVRLLQVLRERTFSSRRPPTTDLATWGGNEVVAVALERILVAEGRIALMLANAGIKLPGLSNFAICRTSV